MKIKTKPFFLLDVDISTRNLYLPLYENKESSSRSFVSPSRLMTCTNQCRVQREVAWQIKTQTTRKRDRSGKPLEHANARNICEKVGGKNRTAERSNVPTTGVSQNLHFEIVGRVHRVNHFSYDSSERGHSLTRPITPEVSSVRLST